MKLFNVLALAFVLCAILASVLMARLAWNLPPPWTPVPYVGPERIERRVLVLPLNTLEGMAYQRRALNLFLDTRLDLTSKDRH
jgi:hypothetical protein